MGTPSPTPVLPCQRHLFDLGEEVVVVRGLTDIVVNNTPMYGGEWVPVTTAVANDGLLDLSTLVGRRELVSKLVLDHKLLPLWGDDIHALGLELSRSLTAARFEITLLQPRGGDVPAQIDGEEWGAGTHFRVDVLPGRLPLVVREDFEPPWAAR